MVRLDDVERVCTLKSEHALYLIRRNGAWSGGCFRINHMNIDVLGLKSHIKKQGTPMYEHGHHAISLPNKSSSTNLAVLKLESFSPAGERLLRGCRP